MTHVYQEHGMTAFTSFQMSAPDTRHGVEQAHMLPATPQVSHVESIYGRSHDTFMTPSSSKAPNWKGSMRDSRTITYTCTICTPRALATVFMRQLK
jgi:hypothetical protein